MDDAWIKLQERWQLSGLTHIYFDTHIGIAFGNLEESRLAQLAFKNSGIEAEIGGTVLYLWVPDIDENLILDVIESMRVAT